MLAGQRPPTGGEVLVEGEAYDRTRAATRGCRRPLPARGAAAQRLRAAHVGGRESRLPHLRPPRQRHVRLWLDFRAWPGTPATPDRALQHQDRVQGLADRHPVRRQRPARGARARAVRRRRRCWSSPTPASGSTSQAVADIRSQIVAASEPRRRRAADLRGPRRDPGALRPRPGDVRRQIVYETPAESRTACAGRSHGGSPTDAARSRPSRSRSLAARPARPDRDRHAARLRRARRLRRLARQRRRPPAGIVPDRAPPDRRLPRRRPARDPHPRVPQAGSRRLPAGQAPARQRRPCASATRARWAAS